MYNTIASTETLRNILIIYIFLKDMFLFLVNFYFYCNIFIYFVLIICIYIYEIFKWNIIIKIKDIKINITWSICKYIIITYKVKN